MECLKTIYIEIKYFRGFNNFFKLKKCTFKVKKLQQIQKICKEKESFMPPIRTTNPLFNCKHY